MVQDEIRGRANQPAEQTGKSNGIFRKRYTCLNVYGPLLSRDRLGITVLNLATKT